MPERCEGVIYDLIGRFSHEDVHVRTISAMKTVFDGEKIADMVLNEWAAR